MSQRAIIVTMLASAALVAAPAWFGYSPAFIWNASASVPIGLYRLAPAERPDIGDYVVVSPPEPLVAFLAERGYLPSGVPLIKRVLALPGTNVCRQGLTIIVYDHAYGEARERDRLGRPLPSWQGCRRLADGEVFLMNWDAPDSLDGRYFGPLPVTSIVARALPLWTDADGDGRFQWHLGDPSDAPLPLPHHQNRSLSMAQIGQFVRTQLGYVGRVRTLSLNLPLVFVSANHSDADRAPDYRIRIGDEDGVEIGAGWIQGGDGAGKYISVLLDDPWLAQPIRARLVQSDKSGRQWGLHWTRAKKRDDRDKAQV